MKYIETKNVLKKKCIPRTKKKTKKNLKGNWKQKENISFVKRPEKLILQKKHVTTQSNL